MAKGLLRYLAYGGSSTHEHRPAPVKVTSALGRCVFLPEFFEILVPIFSTKNAVDC